MLVCYYYYFVIIFEDDEENNNMKRLSYKKSFILEYLIRIDGLYFPSYPLSNYSYVATTQPLNSLNQEKKIKTSKPHNNKQRLIFLCVYVAYHWVVIINLHICIEKKEKMSDYHFWIRTKSQIINDQEVITSVSILRFDDLSGPYCNLSVRTKDPMETLSYSSFYSKSPYSYLCDTFEVDMQIFF